MFTQYIAQLNGAESTQKSYIETGRHLLRFLQEGKYPYITPQVIQAFLYDLQLKGLANATIRKHYRNLRAVFRYALKTGIIKSNPIDSVPEPAICNQKVKRPFSPAEITLMLSAIENDLDPYHLKIRNRTILLTLYDTGIRTGALVNIKVRDLNLDAHTIEIIEKGNKPNHLVGFGTQTGAAIRKHLNTIPDLPDCFLFPNRNGRQLTIYGIYKMIQKTCDQAGVDRRKVHMLRYSYTGQALINGMDKGAIQKQLGHTTTAMIDQIYGSHVLQQWQIAQQIMYSPGDRLTGGMQK
ncbi:MAG: tyrosine-type recombinase/integrase [Chloroflexota bacterium]|nr:tyrosine-type recombinase/integrase [Chloroflexota bacterium]